MSKKIENIITKLQYRKRIVSKRESEWVDTKLNNDCSIKFVLYPSWLTGYKRKILEKTFSRIFNSVCQYGVLSIPLPVTAKSSVRLLLPVNKRMYCADGTLFDILSKIKNFNVNSTFMLYDKLFVFILFNRNK